MGYIGPAPTTSFQSFVKQDITTSATANYTLSQSVTNANELRVVLNNVIQEPTTAYTASGTSLTMASALTSSDDLYVVYMGKAVGTVNPASGSVGTSELSATGTKDATTFLRGDNSFVAPSFGKVLQVVKSLVTTKASTTSAIPQDNTIPQNTEGTEFTTLAITPQASDSTLYIDFLVMGSLTNNSTNITVCLFKDSDANALQVVNNTCNTNTEMFPLILQFAETSGTTSAVTYKIRFGLAGGGTVYLNSDQSSDVYSTAQSAIFTITEVSA